MRVKPPQVGILAVENGMNKTHHGTDTDNVHQEHTRTRLHLLRSGYSGDLGDISHPVRISSHSAFCLYCYFRLHSVTSPTNPHKIFPFYLVPLAISFSASHPHFGPSPASRPLLYESLHDSIPYLVYFILTLFLLKT